MRHVLEKELQKNWSSLTGHTRAPEQLSLLQIRGTDWKASRVHFAVIDPSGEPLFFAKVVRDPQQNAQLEKEYHLLASLVAKPGLAAHLPQPCLLGELDKQKYSVERAVRGTKMLQGIPRCFWHVGQFFPRYLSRTTDLLVKLARGTRTAISTQEFLAEELRPLRVFLTEVGRSRAELDPLFDSLQTGFRGSFESIVAHGDLSPGNLIMQPDDSCGLIDWETANLNGLPLIDLFYFITRYVYVGGLVPWQKKAKAIKTFYASSAAGIGYAKQAVEKYCQELGYDTGIIAPLFRLHFVYRAYLKSTMVGLDSNKAQLWLELFDYYQQGGKHPWNW